MDHQRKKKNISQNHAGMKHQSSVRCWHVVLSSALWLQGLNHPLLCTASTAGKTSWLPTSALSTLHLLCESPHRHRSYHLFILRVNNTFLHVLSLRSLSALQLASTPSKLTPPFPQIFSRSLDARGFLQSQPAPPGCKHISSFTVSFCPGVFVVAWRGQFKIHSYPLNYSTI